MNHETALREQHCAAVNRPSGMHAISGYIFSWKVDHEGRAPSQPQAALPHSGRGLSTHLI